MGVNLFVPIPAKYTSPAQIETLVSAANVWGAELDAFDWCDVFKGGPAILTLAQALAFSMLEPEAGPWFVLTIDSPDEFFTIANEPGLPKVWAMHESEFFWCAPGAKFDNSQTGPADWQALLRESGCDRVLFCKART